MRITSKGQVTIPQSIREHLGLLPYGEVDFVVENGRVWLRKPKQGAAHGRQLVERLRGKATARLGTDAIMAMTRGE